MPPANDIIKRNVKDIYINPKDYIKEASVEKKDEKVSSCANCRSGRCYGCFGGNRA